MSWQDQLKGDSLSWLLETESPEVRYLALRDLLERGAGEGALSAQGRRPRGIGRLFPAAEE